MLAFASLRCLALGAVTACTSCGSDLTQGSQAFAAPGDLDRSLKLDFNTILSGGRSECDATQLAILAERRSELGSVQHYASTLEQEHSALFQELQAIVTRSRGAALPYEMSADGVGQYNCLANYAGSNFDRTFLVGQIHMQEAAQTTLASLRDGDGELSAWAQRAASLWQRDETWARQIYGSIVLGGGISSLSQND